MPRTFDNRGRIVQEQHLNGLGVAYVAPASFGAALWEYLHPEQVQAEYAQTTGAEPPSIEDIQAGASAAMGGSGPGSLSDQFSQAFAQISKYATYGALAWVAVEVLKNWPRGGRR